MKRIRLFGGVPLTLALALALGLAPTASAATILAVDDPNDGIAELTIIDGGLLDSDPTAGVVSFNGTIGAWALTVSTAMGSPALGSPNLPEISLSSVSVSNGAGTLVLLLLETDLTTIYDPLFYEYSISGATVGALGGASWCAGVGPANGLNLTCSPGIGGGSTGILAGPVFGTSTNGVFSGLAGAPFALKAAVIVRHESAGTTNFEARLKTVADVPEPSTLLLSGFALLGLATLRRRRDLTV